MVEIKLVWTPAFLDTIDGIEEYFTVRVGTIKYTGGPTDLGQILSGMHPEAKIFYIHEIFRDDNQKPEFQRDKKIRYSFK